MNQTFQFSRWWMLVTRQWAEHKRFYTLGLIAIGGILLVADVFFSAVEHYSPMDKQYQLISYYWGLFLVGCLYASSIYSELGNKKAAIQWLTVPASTMEKMLTAWFYSTVLFFVAWTMLFYIVDSAMVMAARQILLAQPAPKNGERYLPEIVNIFQPYDRADTDFSYILFSIYFTLQGAFMLGSVYFIRFALIKTVLSLLGILLIAALFEARVVHESLPYGWQESGIFQWRQGWELKANKVANPVWMRETIVFIIKYTLPLIFWSISYVRLKEKEV